MVLTSFSLLGSFSCYSAQGIPSLAGCLSKPKGLRSTSRGEPYGKWAAPPQFLVCSHVPLSFQEKERGTNL